MPCWAPAFPPPCWWPCTFLAQCSFLRKGVWYAHYKCSRLKNQHCFLPWQVPVYAVVGWKLEMSTMALGRPLPQLHLTPAGGALEPDTALLRLGVAPVLISESCWKPPIHQQDAMGTGLCLSCVYWGVLSPCCSEHRHSPFNWGYSSWVLEVSKGFFDNIPVFPNPQQDCQSGTMPC